MPAELLCPKHGPYDASLGVCPVCSGRNSRPAAPLPLDEDDMKTDPGFSAQPAGPAPRYSPAGGVDEDNMETYFPGGSSRRRGGGKKFLDDDDDGDTKIEPNERDDVTELENVVAITTAILWVKEGQRRGQIFKITKDRTVIGRDADITLDDKKASRQHAAVTVEAGQFVIWNHQWHIRQWREDSRSDYVERE
jgi:hypothetical protein